MKETFSAKILKLLLTTPCLALNATLLVR